MDVRTAHSPMGAEQPLRRRKPPAVTGACSFVLPRGESGQALTAGSALDQRQVEENVTDAAVQFGVFFEVAGLEPFQEISG